MELDCAKVIAVCLSASVSVVHATHTTVLDKVSVNTVSDGASYTSGWRDPTNMGVSCFSKG